MKNLKMILLLCFTTLALIGCYDSESSDESNGEETSFEQLNGNSFLFLVEKEIEQSITDSFSIDESLYMDVEDGDEYTISFSSDRRNISIEPNDLSGVLESSENEKLEYNINNGYFAGGRFLVWIENNVFNAELTEYGSGVPIIAGGKGLLTEIK